MVFLGNSGYLDQMRHLVLFITKAILPPFSSSRILICSGVEQRALHLSKCRCLCDPGVSYDFPKEIIVIFFPIVTESCKGKHVI